MKPPILPQTEERRRLFLDRGRVAFLCVAIALITAAVATALLIVSHDAYVAADPLVLQEQVDGQWVDKDLVVRKQDLVAQKKAIDAYLQTQPDPKTITKAEMDAWRQGLEEREQRLEAAGEDYRRRDQVVTQRYFDLVWRFHVGAWLLLAAGAVLVLGVAIGRYYRPVIPHIDPVHPTILLRREAQLGRWFVVVLISLLAVGLTALALRRADPPPTFGYDPASALVALPSAMGPSTATPATPTVTTSASPQGVPYQERPPVRPPMKSPLVAGAPVSPTAPVIEPATVPSPAIPTGHAAFRGGAGTGVINGENLKPAEVTELWRVDLAPGFAGYSSPVVWHRGLFLAGRDDSGDAVHAYDRLDGHLLWKRSMVVDPQAPPPRCWNDERSMLAACTPATDGRTVVAVFADGWVLACDVATGADRWHTRLSGASNRYGASQSPLVFGETVIVSWEHDGEGSGIYAFDITTGKQRWFVERQGQHWATPCLVRDDQTTLLVCGGRQIDVYDAATGAPRWQGAGVMEGDVAPSPAVGGLADGGTAVVQLFKDSGMVAYVLTGDSVVPGDSLWASDTDRALLPDSASPVLARGRIWVLNQNGDLLCYDASTGERRYQESLAAGGAYASPLVVGDHLVLLGLGGALRICGTDATYAELIRRDLQPAGGHDVFAATPAIADGRIYVRSTGQLIALGPATPGGAPVPAATATPVGSMETWQGDYDHPEGAGTMTLVILGAPMAARRQASFVCRYNDDDITYTGHLGPVGPDGALSGEAVVVGETWKVTGTIRGDTFTGTFDKLDEESPGTFTFKRVGDPAGADAGGAQ